MQHAEGGYMSKENFVEIANASISPQRQAVISRFEDGSFTIGQRVKITEGNKTMSVFLKGAIHIDGIDSLQNLRDALNVALSNFS